MQEKIQFYTTVYSDNRRRHCQFWFNAERPGTNVWRIRMNADYVGSEVISTQEDPHEVLARWLKEWKEAL